jgi:putative oxidoreductase
MKNLQLLARIIAAIIMLQTLYFKFTAQPESIYIFSTLGLEPVGRIGSGIAELMASILLLIPFTSWIGAILGVGIMAGAIFSHLTILGIEVQGDGGQLFIMALITFICCLFVLFYERAKVRNFVSNISKKRTK